MSMMIRRDKAVFYAGIEASIKAYNEAAERDGVFYWRASEVCTQAGFIPREEARTLPGDFVQRFAALAPLYAKTALSGVEVFEMHRLLDLMWLDYNRLLEEYGAVI